MRNLKCYRLLLTVYLVSMFIIVQSPLSLAHDTDRNSPRNYEKAQSAPIMQAKPIGYRIVNANSGKCLDIKSGDRVNNANIQQYECHTGPNQNWVMKVNLGAGLSIISTYSGKCLDVNEGIFQNRANIQQYECRYTPNQGFLPVLVSNTNNASIYNGDKFRLLAAQPYITNQRKYCVDVRGGVVENGGNIQLYECHDGPNQQFILEAVYESTEEYCEAEYLHVTSPYYYPARNLQFDQDGNLQPSGVARGEIATIDLRSSSEPDIFGRKSIAWLCMTGEHMEEISADVMDMAKELNKNSSIPSEQRLEITICSGGEAPASAQCGISESTLEEVFKFVITFGPFQEAVRSIFDPDPSVKYWCPANAKNVVVKRDLYGSKFTLTCIG